MKIIDQLPLLENCEVCIMGLGYVGLPLAVEISKTKICKYTGTNLSRKVIGFDISEKRLNELRSGIDITKELTNKEISTSGIKNYTLDSELIINSDLFIITVPTPIDSANKPDLKALKSASSIVAEALKKRKKNSLPLVVYESTVFPGATCEICVPIIEKISGLKLNNDFFCGYSPERINPGDKKYKLDSIVKITSGSNAISSIWIDKFYKSIIGAGTFQAKSIKVAEAAKIIENTQRDINIALVNELAMICEKLRIDTLDVLEAAQTKWNFINFKPGLVGGHCIGVDPYYLTYKSQLEGYLPEVVLAGRRINDGMPKWIVEKLILTMAQKEIVIKDSKILILGFSFKENCTDIRNTKVSDIIKLLEEYKTDIDVVDPFSNKEEAEKFYDVKLHEVIPNNKKYSAIIVCVAHSVFKEIEIKKWKDLLIDNGFIFDIKGIVPREIEALRL